MAESTAHVIGLVGRGTGREAEEVPRGPVDVTMLLVVAALVCLGLLAVYNASALKSYFSGGGDDLVYLRRQASGAVLGVIGMMIASRIDYRFYQRRIYWITAGTFVLLVLTAIPGIAVTVNGATRWIRVAGVTFQPAELVKVWTVLYLAYSIAKKGAAMQNFVESFVAHGIVFLGFVVLLMKQPDLGSSVVICTLVGVMLYVGGARASYMMGFGGVAALLLYAAIIGRSYGMDRVRAWLDPWSLADSEGYHLVNSYVALARGGLTGTGLGEGGGRLGYVPELYNDFVAASVGEEFGLVGMCGLALLYVLFIWRGMSISRRATDAFGAYLAFGITMLVGIQAAINLCVVTGLLPTKGLTLPFVSYGRSSLLLLLFAVGILMNIAQRNPNIYAERSDAARVRAENERERRRDERQRARRRTRRLRALGEHD